MTDASSELSTDHVARMANDLEKIAAHLVPLLKASYHDTQERLKRAERVIASRQERPAIVGMHRLLGELRRLEPGAAAGEFVEEGLLTLLNGLGYKEFGRVGEPYDPAHHEPVGGQTEGGKGKVSTVHRRGLACFGDVVVRAVVEVTPDPVAPAAATPAAHTDDDDGAFPLPAADFAPQAVDPFDHATEGQ